MFVMLNLAWYVSCPYVLLWISIILTHIIPGIIYGWLLMLPAIILFIYRVMKLNREWYNKLSKEAQILIDMTVFVMVGVFALVEIVIIVECMIGMYAGGNYWDTFVFVVFSERTYNKYIKGLEEYDRKMGLLNHFWN